jgi:hypothetical protein
VGKDCRRQRNLAETFILFYIKDDIAAALKPELRERSELEFISGNMHEMLHEQQT